MAIHDAYARLTPFELTLPDREWAEERFDEIEGEADARGSDLTDPDAFVMLMSVGRMLRELRGPDDDPERIREHGALVYHAFHFQRAGERLLLLSTHAARYLVESDYEAPAWEPGPPAPAAYVQLPRHLFWLRPDEETTPEPVDGLYWSLVDDRIAVLPVLGVRKDRPGVSVVSLPPAPLDDAPRWLAEDIREEGTDFESSMPGAELERLYELRTAGEILKLTARILHYLESRPDARRSESPPAEASGPRPTALAYDRITLD